MNSLSRAVRLTLWLNRALVLLVALLTVSMPGLIRWYNSVRILSGNQNLAILAAFYACVPVVLYALWNLDRLLRNIRSGDVFIHRNVCLIRRECICCATVGLICLPAAFFYAPLIFMTIIMGFLCPVVYVLCLVFRAAVELQEESDLTV